MKEPRVDQLSSDKQHAGSKGEQYHQKTSEVNESQTQHAKGGCSFCGLKNHVFEDYKRRSAC